MTKLNKSLTIIKHTLPGEDGENKGWFERLNEFEQTETRRQVQFKRKHFPGTEDGSWSKDPTRKYPHILPKGDLKRVFYTPIAQQVLEYCDNEQIALHTEIQNLRSSQVCCFNVVFLLKQDLKLAAEVLRVMLPGVKEVKEIEFEFTGDDEASKWLGEQNGGKRGQNRTSIDVAIRWTDGVKNYWTLCEWKYTEQGFGSCGGYQSKGYKDRSFCTDLPAPQYEKNYIACYLHSKKGRQYWQRLDEAGISFNVLEGAIGCPFRGPFYQLLRQYILASYLRQSPDIDEVFVAALHFKDNVSLERLPLYHKKLASSVIDLWNKMLNGVPPLQSVYVEDIVASMHGISNSKLSGLLEYLEERYGLSG
jgi:hypothetical protein